MKRFKKTVFSLILASSLLPNSFAFATDTNVLDNYLVENGYPEEVIALLDIQQKEKAYEQKTVFVSHKRVTALMNESDNNASARSLSNFSHDLVVGQVTSGTAGKVEFILDYNWDWNYDPMYTMADSFGIAWTDDFDAYPGTAVSAYKTFGTTGPTCGTALENGGTNVYGYEKYDPGKGIGWEANLISSWFVSAGCGYATTYRHKGWGEVKIGKFHNGSGLGESTSAVAKYFHNEISGQGELQFSAAGPAITLIGDSSYDVSPDTGETWNWYHRNY
ncbi:hypothetical protein [Paenibacillus oryzisoli]|uniref:Bacterial toxin 44 domain-containing protein n=1 Tax=Paenibacillus oryzisoli TaxID=1850517 RepID=A0A198AC68_9BACL|nr:hypothetical protein [Paenibacillus oryzisoli]OAS18656.1 hypothetical protein A8708_28985 [Paenibacillus oryzisoli]